MRSEIQKVKEEIIKGSLIGNINVRLSYYIRFISFIKWFYLAKAGTEIFYQPYFCSCSNIVVGKLANKYFLTDYGMTGENCAEPTLIGQYLS